MRTLVVAGANIAPLAGDARGGHLCASRQPDDDGCRDADGTDDGVGLIVLALPL